MNPVTNEIDSHLCPKEVHKKNILYQQDYIFLRLMVFIPWPLLSQSIQCHKHNEGQLLKTVTTNKEAYLAGVHVEVLY